MKKIMMTVAFICFAAVTQAAYVDWALARDDAKTWANADVYAVDGSDMAAVLALFAAGGDNVGTTFLSDYAIGGAPADTANSRGAAGLSTDVGSASKLAFVIFEDNQIAGGQKFYYTATYDVSEMLYTPPQEVPLSLDMEATSFANSGTIANVPEPTSGLLLLLGMAGLALRRKQS